MQVVPWVGSVGPHAPGGGMMQAPLVVTQPPLEQMRTSRQSGRTLLPYVQRNWSGKPAHEAPSAGSIAGHGPVPVLPPVLTEPPAPVVVVVDAPALVVDAPVPVVPAPVPVVDALVVELPPVFSRMTEPPQATRGRSTKGAKSRCMARAVTRCVPDSLAAAK
jgi:hypothetical protein